MTDVELQQLVSNISDQVFHKPFIHQAYFNGRLRTTGGRYLLQSHNIEINPKAFEKHGLEEVEGIIRHELCHYHLHLTGRGYKHRDADFRLLMKLTNAPRFCSNLMDAKKGKSTKRYTYICLNCGMHYTKKIRMNLNKYRCGKCNGKIKQDE